MQPRSTIGLHCPVDTAACPSWEALRRAGTMIRETLDEASTLAPQRTVKLDELRNGIG